MREHITAIYPVLPTMQGANDALLRRAMEELGELHAARKLVVSVVAARFPSLADLAKKRVAQLNNPGACASIAISNLSCCLLVSPPCERKVTAYLYAPIPRPDPAAMAASMPADGGEKELP